MRRVSERAASAIGQKVALVVNYDGFTLDPAVSDAYFAMVRYMESALLHHGVALHDERLHAPEARRRTSGASRRTSSRPPQKRTPSRSTSTVDRAGEKPANNELCSSAAMAENHRPRAIDCSSPKRLKGTSAYLTAMSISASPAASAASRATLPALCRSNDPKSFRPTLLHHQASSCSYSNAAAEEETMRCSRPRR